MSAYLPKLKAVIVGDRVHDKTHAWTEGAFLDSLGGDREKFRDTYRIDDWYYKKLAAEMEEAFPDYQHSFLTRSGRRACWDCAGAERP